MDASPEHARLVPTDQAQGAETGGDRAVPRQGGEGKETEKRGFYSTFIPTGLCPAPQSRWRAGGGQHSPTRPGISEMQAAAALPHTQGGEQHQSPQPQLCPTAGLGRRQEPEPCPRRQQTSLHVPRAWLAGGTGAEPGRCRVPTRAAGLALPLAAPVATGGDAPAAPQSPGSRPACASRGPGPSSRPCGCPRCQPTPAPVPQQGRGEPAAPPGHPAAAEGLGALLGVEGEEITEPHNQAGWKGAPNQVPSPTIQVPRSPSP